jgi:hypothetical protein
MMFNKAIDMDPNFGGLSFVNLLAEWRRRARVEGWTELEIAYVMYCIKHDAAGNMSGYDAQNMKFMDYCFKSSVIPGVSAIVPSWFKLKEIEI